MKCLDDNSYDRSKCNAVSDRSDEFLDAEEGALIGSVVGDFGEQFFQAVSFLGFPALGDAGTDSGILQYRDCKKSWVGESLWAFGIREARIKKADSILHQLEQRREDRRAGKEVV